MNQYSVDPLGPGYAAAPAPAPVYAPPTYQYQYAPQPDVSKIRDWLPWSIINIFIGWIFIGFVPLIFSLICRSNKRKNDVHGARTMSTLALVFNILVTISGIIGYIAFILWIVLVYQVAKDSSYPYYTSIYG